MHSPLAPLLPSPDATFEYGLATLTMSTIPHREYDPSNEGHGLDEYETGVNAGREDREAEQSEATGRVPQSEPFSPSSP